MILAAASLCFCCLLFLRAGGQSVSGSSTPSQGGTPAGPRSLSQSASPTPSATSPGTSLIFFPDDNWVQGGSSGDWMVCLDGCATAWGLAQDPFTYPFPSGGRCVARSLYVPVSEEYNLVRIFPGAFASFTAYDVLYGSSVYRGSYTLHVFLYADNNGPAGTVAHSSISVTVPASQAWKAVNVTVTVPPSAEWLSIDRMLYSGGGANGPVACGAFAVAAPVSSTSSPSQAQTTQPTPSASPSIIPESPTRSSQPGTALPTLPPGSLVGFDAPGSNIRSFSGSSPFDCAWACASTPTCAAWAWGIPSAECSGDHPNTCYLKSVIGSTVSAPCRVWGLPVAPDASSSSSSNAAFESAIKAVAGALFGVILITCIKIGRAHV